MERDEINEHAEHLDIAQETCMNVKTWAGMLEDRLGPGRVIFEDGRRTRIHLLFYLCCYFVKIPIQRLQNSRRLDIQRTQLQVLWIPLHDQNQNESISVLDKGAFGFSPKLWSVEEGDPKDDDGPVRYFVLELIIVFVES